MYMCQAGDSVEMKCHQLITIFYLFLVSGIFFSFANNILDPDQVLQKVGPDLDLNYIYHMTSCLGVK